MNNTSVNKKFVWIVAVLLAFFVGWQYGHSGYELKVESVKSFVERNREQAPREVNWDLLWNTISRINEKYVNRPADLQKILYGAVEGAVNSLDDPYSVFLAPKQAEDFKNELLGTLEGIGAEIAIKNDRLVVVTPLDGSPAIRAGLRPGDFIFKVDEHETTELSLEEAVNKIRGPAGTKVMLTVFHKGQTKPAEVSIIRARIEVKSVEAEIKTVGARKIGYIKLRRFGEDTRGTLDKIISDFLVRDVDGLIFDVRNNPGGFLETAVEVASNWVKEGEPVVIQKFGDGSEDVFRAEGQPRLAGVPTIVLINGGSASASEIVAGALRDYGIAKLVGEKSFGKGSVQELISLQNKAQLKLTIAKWLTPNGHDLNKEGLEPDIKIELKEEDFTEAKDPQLDQAIEELTK